jgi:hypothetical protein
MGANRVTGDPQGFKQTVIGVYRIMRTNNNVSVHNERTDTYTDVPCGSSAQADAEYQTAQDVARQAQIT